MYLVMVKLQKWMFLELFLNVRNLRIVFLSFILSEKVNKDDNVNLCNLVRDNQRWFVRCAIARGVFLGSRFKDTKMTFFFSSFYFLFCHQNPHPMVSVHCGQHHGS